MSTAVKPIATSVGYLYEDGLWAEELRALVEAEGADLRPGLVTPETARLDGWQTPRAWGRLARSIRVGLRPSRTETKRP